ncbi:MAG: hypothetical protein J6I37_07220 [Prevotella sp.]|nr:hypothetical protein [Prevotella sp.]
MKRLLSFHLLVSVLLCMLSVMTGGVMAMAEVPTVPDPKNPVDPVDPNVNNLPTPDGNGAGQGLSGSQASATQLHEGDLVQPDYDEDVIRFRCHKFVLLNRARTVAQQRTCRDYETIHFRIGEEDLTGVTKANIAAGASIKINASNFDGDLRLLTPGSTICAQGVSGYADGSNTKKEGDLMLFVVANPTLKEATCQAINGPAVTNGEYNDSLDDMTCPAIPSGTTLIVCAIAGAESQQEVAPDNFQPRPKTVYLQKQIFNVVFTDYQKRIITKARWAIKDIKAEALRKFSAKAEYSLWLGKQKRFKMLVDPTMGEEYVYTSEGILRQLSNTLGISDDGIEFKDITAITKIQFTEFSEHDEADMYCGKDMLEDIINMKDINDRIRLTQETTEFGVKVLAFSNNFGKLNLIYAPALNKIGYSKFAVVVDMKGARYYTNISKTERTIDMKKGAKDTREASRYIYIEGGALALRGFNSILVGPASLIAKRNVSKSARPVVMCGELPATPYEGMLILLNEDITVNNVTYSSDKVYEYTQGAWNQYVGTVNG